MSSNNSDDGDWLQLLRPSVITGLIRLRRRLADSPSISLEDVQRLLRSTYDNSCLDFAGATVLHAALPDMHLESTCVYQAVIRVVCERASPAWGVLICRGRAALNALDPDTLACFERAGALSATPALDVLEWWDRLAALFYAESDVEKCLVGRKAERLSFLYEASRLKTVDEHAPMPVWKALEDNYVGYDIQSWEQCDGKYIPRFVEVKGTTSIPVTIHVSRHEWDVAVRHGRAHVFQIWHVPTERMTEIAVSELSAHIPSDREAGRWQEVIVTIPEPLLVKIELDSLFVQGW